MPRELGRRVGVPWLGHTCGSCAYCAGGRENLCDSPVFTGYTRDGGFATHVVADAAFAFDLDPDADPVALAPLLCAGLIGWRSLQKAGDGRRIGIYGFGAAAHIIAQVAIWQGREIFAFTRPGDSEAQRFARSLGATWAGSSDEQPPVSRSTRRSSSHRSATLVPAALRAVRKGGRVVCGGIHMSDIPAMPYALLWEERELCLGRQPDAPRRRGVLSDRAPSGRAHPHRTYQLEEANAALADLRAGRLSGAAVLVPRGPRSGWPDQAPAAPRRRICSSHPLRFVSFPPATIPNKVSRTGDADEVQDVAAAFPPTRGSAKP